MKPTAVLASEIQDGFTYILKHYIVVKFSTHRRELFTKTKWFIVVDRPEQLLAMEIEKFIIVSKVSHELIKMAEERKR